MSDILTKFRENFQKILKKLWRKFKLEQFVSNFEKLEKLSKPKEILEKQSKMNFFFRKIYLKISISNYFTFK